MSYISHGHVDIPVPLQIYWLLCKCEFLHDTAYYFIPPGLDIMLRWGPEEEDKVFLIFAVTFGEPRDVVTNEVVLTDKIGFWHRGRGMKLHWDPFVPSILGIVYPHVTPATKSNPFEIRFLNRTDRAIYIDVSVWYFEFTVKDYNEMLDFLNGMTSYFKDMNRKRNEGARL